MPFYDLTPQECRVLGCLMEKERLTPESYPLSLHSLTAACNQSTNREPVMALEEKAVDAAVQGLRDRRLASVVSGAGARVQKFKHRLEEHYKLEPREFALLCVLLLRGDQTAGELRARTERFYGFSSLEEVEACLQVLAREGLELVRLLPARPGQKEVRYRTTFGADAVREACESASAVLEPLVPSRLDVLQAEVAALRAELALVREELSSFRRQFD
jgi:uncharacterized protein YceH (UPF0502 family)